MAPHALHVASQQRPSVEVKETPGYVAITPARDDARNLRRLADSLVAQNLPPLEWVIVDNGSSDSTPAIIAQLVDEHPWITAATSVAASRALPGAPIVRAFHAGLSARKVGNPEIAVKLDADVSVEPGYFERLLAAFRREPLLGIAGGVCYEEEAGDWYPTFSTGDHVRGAVRAYRWECLQDVLPLEERMGWDGIDELKAQVLGWRTRTLENLAFKHHRGVGVRDGGRRNRWWALGEGAHYMGYRPWYLVLRSLHHARRDVAALSMLGGYALAALRRDPVYADPAVRAHLRRMQSVAHLRRRVAEAHGRHVH